MAPAPGNIEHSVTELRRVQGWVWMGGQEVSGGHEKLSGLSDGRGFVTRAALCKCAAL